MIRRNVDPEVRRLMRRVESDRSDVDATRKLVSVMVRSGALPPQTENLWLRGEGPPSRLIDAVLGGARIVFINWDDLAEDLGINEQVVWHQEDYGYHTPEWIYDLSSEMAVGWVSDNLGGWEYDLSLDAQSEVTAVFQFALEEAWMPSVVISPELEWVTDPINRVASQGRQTTEFGGRDLPAGTAVEVVAEGRNRPDVDAATQGVLFALWPPFVTAHAEAAWSVMGVSDEGMELQDFDAHDVVATAMRIREAYGWGVEFPIPDNATAMMEWPSDEKLWEAIREADLAASDAAAEEYEENPDVRTRELERQCLHGRDPAACAALATAYVRDGRASDLPEAEAMIAGMVWEVTEKDEDFVAWADALDRAGVTADLNSYADWHEFDEFVGETDCFDDEVGSVSEQGMWAGMTRLGPDAAMEYLGSDVHGGEPRIDVFRELRRHRSAVVYENDQGARDVELYDTEAEAEEAMDDLRVELELEGEEEEESSHHESCPARWGGPCLMEGICEEEDEEEEEEGEVESNPDIGRLGTVRVEHCSDADKAREKSLRAYAHTFCHRSPGDICVSAAWMNLPPGHRWGILAHEIGHLLAGPGRDEADADAAWLAATGVPIGYSDGPHGRCLQELEDPRPFSMFDIRIGKIPQAPPGAGSDSVEYVVESSSGGETRHVTMEGALAEAGAGDEVRAEEGGRVLAWSPSRNPGRPAAGLMLIRDVGFGPEVLLLLRSHAVTDPGVWGLPGGGIEEGEGAFGAALREAREEAGPDVPAFQVVGTHPGRTSSGGEYVTFACRVEDDSEAARWRPELNWESDEARWFGLGILPPNLHPGVAEAVSGLAAVPDNSAW